MENRIYLVFIKLLGGALLGVFLVLVMPVFAYDKENTHPALTDEIVDFYNLSFTDKKITEEEKQWLIKGSVDEDTLERPLYHFYDPVYNRGIAGFSSKDWATKNGIQAAYYNSQLTGFAAISGGDSANDFSYQRGLDDYAKGDRKRAFVAFGHTLHLLEDAGVPDHTRNDAHPSFIHGQESPYEAEMAKWSPENFNIVKSLLLRREKPVSLNSVESYFDRVANYSNNNFFSKDTIFTNRYKSPAVGFWNYKKIGNTEKVIGYKVNRNDRYVLVEQMLPSRVYTISNTLTLDAYWDRLSKEVVINGAGVLRLFLEEAEKSKREYLAKVEQKKPSFWAQLLGVFGIGKDSQTTAELTTPRVEDDEELTTSDGQRTSDVADTELSTLPTSQVGYPQVTESGDKKVSPTLSPTLSPKLVVSPLVSPLPTSAPINDIECPRDIRCQQKKTSGVKIGHVIINEIAWAGTEASTADEWLELYNTENYDIDLSGWTLKAEDGTPEITIGGGNKELLTSDGQRTSDVSGTTLDVKIIKAQSYFLLERTDDTTVNSILADQLYVGALGNEGEVLRLTDANGTVVDTIGKTGEMWPTGSSIGKISMERTSGGPDASVGVNWKNFTGNPSAKDANGNFINGTPKAQNSQVTVVVTNSGGSGGNQTPGPTLTPSPSLSPLPEPDGDSNGDTANPGDIIINEIAWIGTMSSANDEWIELYNATNQTINLTGWTLNAQDGTPVITLFGSISASGFFLLERTDDETLPTVTADQIYTGALGNTGEHLVLKNASGTIINQVDGSNSWKLNGDDKVVGDNTTKETAQLFGNVWKTAQPTPKTENKENTALNAPSAVANFAAAHNSPTITATWSAPDPGNYILASLSYDLRYSTANFPDDDTWDAATKVASSSLPSVEVKGASQSASFNVTYEYGQTLYFALKTKVINIPTCDVGNVDKCSGISNVATVSFPSAIDDNAWAMFGKDQYHTSFAANVTGPGSMATISWTFEAGSAVSQPVADAKGNIYFGASDGTLANSRIYSVRKEGENIVENWTYGINDSIGTPAVLSDGTVYFGRIGAGGVLAFNALNSDGSNKWDYTNSSSVKSVTVSADGSAFFTTNENPNSRLKVLDSRGELKFEKIGPGFYDFAPVVLDDGTIITVANISGNQQFTAYSEDGEQVWQTSYTGVNGKLPVDPSYDKSTGITYSAAGPKLFSIPSDGSALNSHDIAPWDYSAATMVAITTDTLYLGFNNSVNLASGSLLYAINKSDLSTKWPAPFQVDGLINKQLVIDSAGNPYFSTQNGKLYSVSSTGGQLWIIDSGSNSTISPVLTEHDLVWGYGSKIVVIK